MKTLKELREKAVSQAQQKMMGMALAYKRGEMDDASPEVKKMANSMSMKDLEDFAKTKHKGLPDKVDENRYSPLQQIRKKKEEVELDEAKEYFLTGLDYKGTKHTYKRRGPKVTDPIVVYIDGKEWKTFKSMSMAKKETLKYIKGMKEEVELDEAKVKEYKGIAYFENRKDAESHMKKFAPKGRIVEYERGYAIQVRTSGPYLNKSGKIDEEVELGEAFTPKEIKMAIGVASDKRYAKGNMTGAVNAIEKIKKGLSDHPQVKAVLRRQNESLGEAKANFISLLFNSPSDAKKAVKWMNYNLSGANQGFSSIDASGKYIDLENVDDADGLMNQLKKAGFKFKLDYRESLGEATDFRKGDTVFQVGSKLKGTVQHKGNRDLIAVKFGSINQMIPASKLRLAEEVDLGEGFFDKLKSAPHVAKAGVAANKGDLQAVKGHVSNAVPDHITGDDREKLIKKHYANLSKATKNTNMKTILKKMSESVDLGEAKISVGDRVTLQPNKNTLDRSLIGKAGVVTGMLGSKPTVKFANGKTIAVSPNDLKINESVELDESKNISSITNVGYMDDGGGTALTVRERDAKKLQADLKKNGYEKHSSKRKSGTTMTHFIFKSKGKPDIYISFDGQDGTSYVSYDKDVFESVELGEARKDASADLYFNTYSAAVQYAKAQAEKKGYEVDEDDWQDQVASGPRKPSKDKTVRHTLKLTKNGKPVRQGLSIQVYNRGSDKNPYELNYYVS